MPNGRDAQEAQPERFGETAMTTPTPEAPPADQPAAPTAETPKPTPPPNPADQLGDGGKKAIDAERDARKKAEADLNALRQEIEDSKKTADQKAADALAAARAEAEQSRAQALRYEVAARKGLDLALAARLTGSTKEELEADAEALMALIPKAQQAETPNGPTVPGQQPGGPQAPATITQSDLDALAADGKYDEINKLRREGRLSHLGVSPPKKA